MAAMKIVFDIDTTSFYHPEEEIIRIVAFDYEKGYTEQAFSKFIVPKYGIQKEASEKNLIEVICGEDDALVHDGKRVDAVSQETGINEFYQYIVDNARLSDKVLLIGYYTDGFGAPFLLNAFKKYCDVEPADLDDLGVRFANLYPWFRRHINIENYQERLQLY